MPSPWKCLPHQSLLTQERLHPAQQRLYVLVCTRQPHVADAGDLPHQWTTAGGDQDVVDIEKVVAQLVNALHLWP
jgi:hypothetical protein